MVCYTDNDDNDDSDDNDDNEDTDSPNEEENIDRNEVLAFVVMPCIVLPLSYHVWSCFTCCLVLPCVALWLSCQALFRQPLCFFYLCIFGSSIFIFALF
jgi:hypothetical protein